MKRISIIMLILFTALVMSCGNETKPEDQTSQQDEGQDGKGQTNQPNPPAPAPGASTAPPAVTPPAPGPTTTQITGYNELKNKVNEYKTGIEAKKTALKEEFTTLVSKIKEIPESARLKVDYSATERLNKIYSGLDYDAGAIKELEEVFDKLDVASAHKDVAFDLLRLLYDIGNYTQEVLNDHLVDTNLTKFKDDKDKPKEICTKLYDFMKLRDEIIGEVKAQLKVAVTKKDENDTTNLITELKKINDVSGDMTDIAKKVYLSLSGKQKEIANLVK